MARRVLKLLIFDCDGVLVDSEPLVNRIEAEYFTRLGVPMSAGEACAQFKGKTVEYVVQQLEARLGRSLDAQFGYDWAMTTALGLAQDLQPVAGVQNVIDIARSAGAAVCVASQSPLARVLLSLHVTGLTRYFDANVFTSEMVANPKPAPDLFLFAAQRMGAAPCDAIVIEDSPSGVLAARAAGMRVYGYAAREDAGALKDAGAEIFFSMDELHFDGGLVQDAV
jgi:HAD superfamily hydrolase (TIGR01509 family)